MPLDPVIQALFEQMPELASSPIWDLTPDAARVKFKALCAMADPKAAAIGKTETIEAEGLGEPIALRIYTPVAAGGAAVPVIVFFHGGGFVLGDLDCYDGLCRTLANESGSRVIAVDYRLAPEHPFPAAVEDCFAALKWIEKRAPDLSVDPNRLAVAGDGAGGTLAAVMCLLAKENKGNPQIALQILIYPLARMGGGPRSFASGYFFDQRAIEWMRSYYVPKDCDLNDVRLSPLLAKDAAMLPPAYIVTAGYDPLREDGIAYAEKLKQAGVPVTHIDYPSMIHGFFLLQGLIPLASEAIAAAASAAREILK